VSPIEIRRFFLPGFADWDFEPKLRAPAVAIAAPGVAAMRVGDGPHQGQAESDSWRAGAGRAAPRVATPDAVEIGRAQTMTGIAHLNPRLVAANRAGQSDGAAARAVGERIVEQVGDRLAGAMAVELLFECHAARLA